MVFGAHAFVWGTTSTVVRQRAVPDAVLGRVGAVYRIAVTGGVVIGTPDAASRMVKVMKDVVAETGGFIDLLVATHRHWDHVSGFVQAADDFAKLKVGQVWLAWTENPEDPDAKTLQDDQRKALALLQPAAARLHLAANGEPTLLTSLLEFFGAAQAVSTGDEVDVDLVTGRGRNISRGTSFEFPPTPRGIVDLLEAGGIEPYTLARLRAAAAAGAHKEHTA